MVPPGQGWLAWRLASSFFFLFFSSEAFCFPLEPLFLLGLFFPLVLFFLLGIFFLWSKDALLKKTKTSQRQRQAQAKWSKGWCWPRALIEEKVKTRKAKASQPKIQMWRGIPPLCDSDWWEFLFTFELGLLSFDFGKPTPQLEKKSPSQKLSNFILKFFGAAKKFFLQH